MKKKEYTIIKWIIRVDESKKTDRASLVGFDSADNEYEIRYRDLNGDYRLLDIICTEKKSTHRTI